VICWVVCGVYGNRWYFSHMLGAINEVRGRNLQGEKYEKALVAKGGTSLGMALGLFAVLVAVAGVVGIAVEAALGKL